MTVTPEEAANFMYDLLVDAVQYEALGQEYRAAICFGKACLYQSLVKDRDGVDLEEWDEDIAKLWKAYKEWRLKVNV